jgi:cytochrome c oxidase assembly protein subunit 15
VAQILSGGIMMLTLDSESWHLLTSLLHNMLVAGLFGVLSYMSFVVWRLGEASVHVSESKNVS